MRATKMRTGGMTLRMWIGAGLATALALSPLAASATQSGPPEKSAAARR